MDVVRLIQAAMAARDNAYAPYSQFGVGAALLTQGGRIYTGCNVENAALTPGCCAERVALFSALAQGEWEFQAMAIVGGPLDRPLEQGEYCAPCGVCRQVMAEFCAPTFSILLARGPDDFLQYTLAQLLPLPFGPGNLGASKEG